MREVEVTTQAQLDKALKNLKPGDVIVCLGGTWDNPLVVSGSSTVHASGSSTVHAYGSSTVHASGSSTVRAYDSSTVRAYGSSTVHAYDSSTVHASPYVPISKQGGNVKTKGGVVIDVPDPSTLDAKGWCEFYGVTVTRGTATLFKAVDDDYSTDNARARNIFYAVGAKVTCPDWSSRAECGNGLHVSPRPFMALSYNSAATRYVAVRCKLADLVLIGDKAKVPALTVAFECDIDGESVSA